MLLTTAQSRATFNHKLLTPRQLDNPDAIVGCLVFLGRVGEVNGADVGIKRLEVLAGHHHRILVIVALGRQREGNRDAGVFEIELRVVHPLESVEPS